MMMMQIAGSGMRLGPLDPHLINTDTELHNKWQITLRRVMDLQISAIDGLNGKGVANNFGMTGVESEHSGLELQSKRSSSCSGETPHSGRANFK